MEILFQRLYLLQHKLQSFESNQTVKWFKVKLKSILAQVRSIGVTSHLSDYQQRKLGVFNLINFFQLLSGILIPVIGLAGNPKSGIAGVCIACLPSLVSILVFYLNHKKKYEIALLFYFILYPVLTQFVYLNGINLGGELYFIFYGLLSVFLLQNIGYMLMSIAFCMVPYFMLSVLVREVQLSLATENMGVYIFNQGLAILFIFYGLYLIKTEMTDYQGKILRKSIALRKKNLKIEKQKTELNHKADLLEKQKEELVELNGLKNKLFSIISHDLKSPMYALRTLFRNVKEYNLSAKEIKELVPDVLNDLNYTIGLMDNLLIWAKSQMQGHQVYKETIDVTPLIEDVIHLLRLPAEAKQLSIQQHTEGSVYVYADKDMIHLVLRNLISNAIKFTPQCGTITVSAKENPSFTEVFVKDSGTGISPEEMQKINSASFYTTHGTAAESGTGLGLMLCKEFLSKNSGKLHIESEPGKGSTFSFTLPEGEKTNTNCEPCRASFVLKPAKR